MFIFKLGFVACLSFLISACSHGVQSCSQLPENDSVGNAGCLVIHSGKVLMIQQNIGSNWSMPGGGKQFGERAVCTAHRETFEETGLEITVIEEIEQFANGFRLYRCEPSDTLTLSPNDRFEVKQAAWLDKDQRQSVPWRFPEQRELIEAWVERDNSDH